MESLIARVPPAHSINTGSVPLGAAITGAGASFLVWAPRARSVDVHIVEPEDSIQPLQADREGYFYTYIPGVAAGTRYFYRLNGEYDRPDPASRSQPAGVHGPSEVVEWRSGQRNSRWAAPELRDYVVYEIHPGTFTQEGTLDAIIPCLDRLRRLGITAIELMPLAEYPGARNWGYDGVCPYAVSSHYGGRAALLRLARACHSRGLALVVDVVYNHLGPEGNYLRDYGPYFTDQYHTPWGEAINFDGPNSDPVRRYFLENALYWVRDCEIDALRLDAVHAIFDRSAYPFIEELGDRVHRYGTESGRAVYLIAESDLNDARLLRPKDRGGYGLDAQWSDDFHHCLHSLLTGETSGYYRDFTDIRQFAAALSSGWVYRGQYSKFRRRRFGNSPEGIAPERFVVCAQNHDQVGNRMLGERLCHIVDWERAKLAAAAVILAPFTPLLFMGEEYAEVAPFQYHVSHTDPDLQRAVREGRKAEFAFFQHGEVPDPQDEATFLRSKLNQHLAERGRHAVMHALYTELIRLRRSHRALRPLEPEAIRVECRAEDRVIEFGGEADDCGITVFLNFSGDSRSIAWPGPNWRKCFDSSDPKWAENGAQTSSRSDDGDAEIQPFSCVVLGACTHR